MRLVLAALLVVAAVLYLWRTEQSLERHPLPGPTVERSAPATEAPRAEPRREEAKGHGARVGFASQRGLDEHFEKHAAEFGAISKAEYLRRAQALRDATVGGDILEIRRADGVTTRFDRASGGFVAVNRDGTIRTFFRPNDGERYFRRQAER
jgi:hypothetical protein